MNDIFTFTVIPCTRETAKISKKLPLSQPLTIFLTNFIKNY